MIGVTVTRKRTMSDALRRHGLSVGRRVGIANEAAYKTLLAEADKLVPRDTEELAKSGRVSTNGTAFGMVVYVGYGSPDAEGGWHPNREGKLVWRRPYDYAFRVHLNAEGKTFQTGEELFLLKPLMNKREEMRQSLRASLRSNP